MNEIPDEIRKMFPDQPIHKIDIDPDGNLRILASAEPLNEPDFENMPIEQVNKYLREHGYDPEQVGIRGKILTDALIENIQLRDRATAAEVKAAGLDQMIEMYKKMLRSKDIIINQQEHRITALAEKLLKIAGN